MKRKVLLEMPIILAFIGCKDDTSDVLVVNDDDAQEVWFEDVTSNVKVVPLKSKEPIGSIKNLLCIDNEIIALDNDNSTIYYFDNGTLVSKMNHLGRGRGEYLEIRRYTYSPSRKEMYVISGKSILRYSVPSMQYVGTTQVEGNINYLSIHDNDNFFASFNAEGKSMTALIDIRTGKVTKKIEQISSYNNEESDISMSSYSMKNHYYAKEDYINTIVSVNQDNEAKTLLRYNFGDKSIPEKYINYDPGDLQIIAELFEYMMENGNTRLQGNQYLKIKGDNISFWYYHSTGSIGEKYYYQYNINSKISTNLKGFRIKGISRPVLPFAVTDDGYVALFEGDPNWFKTDEDKSPLAQQILEGMEKQEMNNPVLLFYEIN